MTSGKEFYIQDLELFKSKSKQLQKQLLGLSLARVVVFLLLIGSIFIFYNKPLYLAVFGILLLTGFFWLLAKYSNKKALEQYALSRVKINELELKALDGDYSNFPKGELYKNPNHAYSEDIDLFGNRSFFQFLTRCQTPEAELCLANLLKANHTEEVVKKQEAVKELADKIEWRHNYRTTASMIEGKLSVASLSLWLTSYKGFTKAFFKWLPKVFSLLSILVIVLYAQNVISTIPFLIWISLGYLISNKYKKGREELSQKLAVSHALLADYAKLLKQIETSEFSSEILKNKQAVLLEKDGTTASDAIARLAKGLQNLEHSNNLLVNIVGNCFFLYDLWVSYPIEQWLEKYSEKVAVWLEVAAYFEAQDSLANFAYNNPTYTYPTISNVEIAFEAKELSHPLLLQKTAVPSDVKLGASDFLIITGANMAGKSTFLRSVSLAILMANIGLPIRAKNAEYTPLPLLTSMRTTDSLDQETSYFFAELKRLRFIVDQLQERRSFVILDEILKGTNSTDKADGSIRFIKKLVTLKATGLVATHDLSLCSIADEMPEIKNFFFDTQIKNEDLFFDYSLKPGVCSDRNASFLLKKMKIVD